MNRTDVVNVQRVFHYTTGLRLRDIVRDGVINPANMNVESTEKPAVWCSTNPFWERTVFKAVRRPDGTIVDLTRDELAERVGLGRIEVSSESAPFDWRYHKLHSGIQPELARGLVVSAKRRYADPRGMACKLSPDSGDRMAGHRILGSGACLMAAAGEMKSANSRAGTQRTGFPKRCEAPWT